MIRNDLISLFVKRFLSNPSYSVYKTEFRGLVNATRPAIKPATANYILRNLPDNPIGTSFIRIARAIGIRGISPSSVENIRWAQNATMVLSGITKEDQDDALRKYNKLHSEVISPNKIIPGLFYTYKYRAESVDDYDVYPLTLVLSRTENTMIGMNFHYLPMNYRMALFAAMTPLMVPLPVDQLTTINITYNMLSSYLGTGLPTIKKYRFDRFKTNAVFISPVEWAVAIAYPSQEFKGKSERTVWRESVKSI